MRADLDMPLAGSSAKELLAMRAVNLLSIADRSFKKFRIL